MFKEIVNIMSSRGYQFRNSVKDYFGQLQELSFIKVDDCLNCIVYPNKPVGHNFEIMTNLYPGLITITSNICGPLSDIKLFKQKEIVIKSIISSLNNKILGGK